MLQSKVLVSPDSDPGYQGYVARQYTYYNHDSYYSKVVYHKSHLTSTLLSICLTFAIVNVLIPILSITRGKQTFQVLTNIAVTSKPRVYKATALVAILVNITYSLITLILHIQGQPNVIECHLSTADNPCSIPPTETAYDYVIGILITKVVAIPVAIIIELAVAVYIAKSSWQMSKTKPKRFTCIVQTFVIWQLFIFVQITVGLVSVPLIVMTFISPARVILLGGIAFMVCMVLIFIFATIPFPTVFKVQFNQGFFLTWFVAAETLITAAAVISAIAAYYLILKDGKNMDGIKGYVLSLIPTIFISIFIWVIKKKLSGEKFKKTKNTKIWYLKDMPFKRQESPPSTEEELLSSEE